LPIFNAIKASSFDNTGRRDRSDWMRRKLNGRTAA